MCFTLPVEEGRCSGGSELIVVIKLKLSFHCSHIMWYIVVIVMCSFMHTYNMVYCGDSNV